MKIREIERFDNILKNLVGYSYKDGYYYNIQGDTFSIFSKDILSSTEVTKPIPILWERHFWLSSGEVLVICREDASINGAKECSTELFRKIRKNRVTNLNEDIDKNFLSREIIECACSDYLLRLWDKDPNGLEGKIFKRIGNSNEKIRIIAVPESSIYIYFIPYPKVKSVASNSMEALTLLLEYELDV